MIYFEDPPPVRRHEHFSSLIWYIACAVMGVATPGVAWAHAIDERHDLNAPLAWFVAGAALMVALSLAVALLFARRAPVAAPPVKAHAGAWLAGIAWLSRLLSLGLFVLAIAAAWYGSGDPLMNLAPALIWIVAWVGISLVCASVGNVWPALDPWRTVYDLVDGTVRRLTGRRLRFGWHYPVALGAWPAVALLLAWAWLELVHPIALVPRLVAVYALAWSAFTWLGMIAFGREAWQANADLFAVYFHTLGRFAPVSIERREVTVRAWGTGLLEREATASQVAFVLAMLSTVLFDGLRNGAAWNSILGYLRHHAPQLLDINGYAAGTAGLLGVWLVFLAAYLMACRVAARLTGSGGNRLVGSGTARLARHFAFTLVPIAIGYLVAHNFSSLLEQGQNVIPLLSDPFGRHWDLFGTADFRPNTTLVDARFTWGVALVSIVLGHVIAVWLAHRVALRELESVRRATVASLVLTALMVVYTAVSLSIIAEPMVRFEEPAASR